MSRAPFMDPTPIAIIAIHEMTFVSTYEDECPIARGRELTDRLIHTKRAMPQTSVKLIGLFSDLVRKNPRRLSASFDRHSTMLERMAAIGRMDPALADQFEDGQTATICSHRLVDALSSVMRDKANPPMCKKPISGQNLRYAAFHCPHGTDALATEIINALPSERGEQAVLEFDAAGAPRIHFVTTGETIRQAWTRVVQKTRSTHHPFCSGAKPALINPEAFAILRDTLGHVVRPNPLDTANACRSERPGTKGIRFIRDQWAHAAETVAMERKGDKPEFGYADGLAITSQPNASSIEEAVAYIRECIPSREATYRKFLGSCLAAKRRRSQREARAPAI